MTAPPATVGRLRVALAAMVVIALIGGAAVVVGVIVQDPPFGSPIMMAMVGTPPILIFAAAAGLILLASIEKGRFVNLSWFTMAALSAVAAGWLVMLWLINPASSTSSLDHHWRALATLSILLVMLLFAGQALAMPIRSPWLKAARIALLSNAILFLSLVIWMVWARAMRRANIAQVMLPLASWWGALTLLASFGVLGAAGRSGRRRARATETVAGEARLRYLCPRCCAEQVSVAGVARCRHCRQVLLIEIEEPRCECGYLLYRLAGEACPECGRAIAAAGPAP
jgi:hypothetical protein